MDVQNSAQKDMGSLVLQTPKLSSAAVDHSPPDSINPRLSLPNELIPVIFNHIWDSRATHPSHNDAVFIPIAHSFIFSRLSRTPVVVEIAHVCPTLPCLAALHGLEDLDSDHETRAYLAIDEAVQIEQALLKERLELVAPHVRGLHFAPDTGHTCAPDSDDQQLVMYHPGVILHRLLPPQPIHFPFLTYLEVHLTVYGGLEHMQQLAAAAPQLQVVVIKPGGTTQDFISTLRPTSFAFTTLRVLEIYWAKLPSDYLIEYVLPLLVYSSRLTLRKLHLDFQLIDDDPDIYPLKSLFPQPFPVVNDFACTSPHVAYATDDFRETFPSLRILLFSLSSSHIFLPTLSNSLEILSLTHVRDETVHAFSYHLRTCSLPPTLRRLLVEWDGDQLDPSSVEALRKLAACCETKSITLLGDYWLQDGVKWMGELEEEATEQVEGNARASAADWAETSSAEGSQEDVESDEEDYEDDWEAEGWAMEGGSERGGSGDVGA
ncbi:hypothetical protein JCM11641_006557 [Rhodosporidiobolus odoratus]